jgi:N-acyl amino acid synthase of PEP-CTERM/exosortase system
VNLEKNTFDDCFEIFIADTPESKKIHYQLRYSIYAEQVGVGYKALFQEQMESDVWDNCAVHFLARHKASGAWVGGLRLVFANNDVLPFADGHQAYQEIASKAAGSAVELSRLCIVNKPSKSGFTKANFNAGLQGKSVMWGLIRAAGVYSLHHKIEHWFFEMAPPLAGLLASTGFELQPISTASGLSGLRQPYQLCVENVLAHSLWLKDYKVNYQLYSGLSADAFYKLVANYLSFFQQNRHISHDPIREFG